MPRQTKAMQRDEYDNAVRCKTCHYSLLNLTEHRCTEYGNAFDPNDPNTFEVAGATMQRWARLRTIAALSYAMSLAILFITSRPPFGMSNCDFLRGIALLAAVNWPVSIGLLYVVAFILQIWLRNAVKSKEIREN